MLISPLPKSARTRAGAVLPLAVIALTVLIGAAALSIDLGSLIAAAARAQDIADAAALAAVSRPNPSFPQGIEQHIEGIVQANNGCTALEATWNPAELVTFTGNTAVPGYGTLRPDDRAVTVFIHVDVPFHFARALGIKGAAATRKSTAARVSAAGAPIVPMWISHETPLSYGQSQELHIGRTEAAANTPGNFGWLTPKSGSNDFSLLLGGYNVPPAKTQANFVQRGDIVYGSPGEAVGQWRSELDYNYPNSRLQRATQQPWASDTFDSFRYDNPRLIVVPMCEYLGGTGSGSQFRIIRFGVFWLESVQPAGSNSTITGRFVDYNTPNQGLQPDMPTGIWTVKLIK